MRGLILYINILELQKKTNLRTITLIMVDK